MPHETSTTLTLKRSKKKRLESLKGKRVGIRSLRNSTHKREVKSAMNSLSELRELLDDKDLDRIAAPSKKFRKEFKLG